MFESPTISGPEAKFHVWGSDGSEPDEDENEDDQEEDPEDDDESDDPDEPVVKAKGKPAKRSAAGSDDDEDDDGDEDEDGEDELDKIKRENIKLKKQLDKQRTTQRTRTRTDNKAKSEYAKLEAKHNKAMAFIDKELLKTAIKGQEIVIKGQKYEWHDVDDVSALLDRTNIIIDLEAAEVQGLDVELKRIAKKKPHLLRKVDGDDEDEQPEQQRRQSGGHPFRAPQKGSQRVLRQTKVDEDGLKSKYMKSVSGMLIGNGSK